MQLFYKSLAGFLFAFMAMAPVQDCIEGLNLKPMYGEVRKCPQQLAADKEFVATARKEFGDLKAASGYMSSKGWENFYRNDLDGAMKRFNQAWLLDKSDYKVFWGFANILGRRQDYKEAIRFFSMAKQFKPKDANLYISSATAYGSIFQNEKDPKALFLSMEDLKTAVKIDNKNAVAYAQLAAAFTYLSEKDSAMAYVRKADKIDPKAVNPKVREILTTP